MGWAAIGGALVVIGAAVGVPLAIWGATSHLWSDGYFLAGFVGGCVLACLGLYVLVAEFIADLPLPATRHERRARRLAQSSPPRPWQREVVSRLQENLSRVTSEQQQDRARREARELANLLAELHVEGQALRNVPAHEQTAAPQWDGKVRAELTPSARRFVPEWDAVAPLLTTDGPKIVAFLDAKLSLLLRIIGELRDGK
jgi:hypothetical protein